MWLNTWSNAWLGTSHTSYSSLLKENFKKSTVLKFELKAGTCSVGAYYTVTKNLFLKSWSETAVSLYQV